MRLRRFVHGLSRTALAGVGVVAGVALVAAHFSSTDVAGAASTDVIATGPGEGGGPRVRTFGPAGQDGGVNYYSAGTPIGGTNVAVADVTGAYTAGQPIAFGGKSVTFTGAPATGDTYTVQPANKGSTNVFDNLQALINTLKTPINSTNGTGQANLSNALTTFNQLFGNTYDNVTTVRTTVGSRMNELTSLNNIGDTNSLNYQSQLSDLLDVDWNSAATKFAQLQAALQASQQSFMQTQKLSLFNFL